MTIAKDQPDAAKFVLRIPPPLHKKIRKLAKSSNISMNSYIIRSLADQIKPEFTLKTLIQRLEAKKAI